MTYCVDTSYHQGVNFFRLATGEGQPALVVDDGPLAEPTAADITEQSADGRYLVLVTFSSRLLRQVFSTRLLGRGRHWALAVSQY
jgi:hypothetical protein